MDPLARGEISTALNAVDGLKVTPYFTQSATPGQGCVKFAGATPDDNGFGYVTRWQVWLVVPQDRRQGELWIEEHHDGIESALKRLWVPTAIVPIDLVFNPNSPAVNGIIYEGVR